MNCCIYEIPICKKHSRPCRLVITTWKLEGSLHEFAGFFFIILTKNIFDIACNNLPLTGTRCNLQTTSALCQTELCLAKSFPVRYLLWPLTSLLLTFKVQTLMPLISWSSSYWITDSCDFALVSFSPICLTKMLKMIIFTTFSGAIHCLISIAAWPNAVWGFQWKLWVIWYIFFVRYSG